MNGAEPIAGRNARKLKAAFLDLSPGLTFWALLAVTALVYWPGLSGPFLYDDYPHLAALSTGDGINDWKSLYTYVTSGFSGPTGRPVALLSFLLDANDWPASARAFKYTNLCIHLLNGCLLLLVSLQLLRQLRGERQLDRAATVAAVLSVAVWLLHPYLVSTTLYVVQRMAMLSTLFVFTGIAIWVSARSLVTRKPRKAYFWMTFALVVPGSLAALSKENGALLPVLILVIESTVFRYCAPAPLNRYWKGVFLVLPSLLILAYLLYYPSRNGWFEQYSNRDFSPVERLMTEARILFDYLRHWFIPGLYTKGLFHDGISVSRGLVSPPRTLAAVAALAAIVYFSVKKRSSYPLVSMAVLFFLASHLVESTTIALDIKFEHRMYLGSGFLILPLFYYLVRIPNQTVVVPFMILVPVLLALMCWENARLWSNYESMTRVWSDQAPRSPRAQVEATKALYEQGKGRQALRLINQAGERLPDSFFVRITQLLVQCRNTRAQENVKADVVALAERTEYAPIWFFGMENLMRWSGRTDCRGLDMEYFAQVVEALLSAEQNQDRNSLGFSHLAYFKGIASLQLGRHQQALTSLEAAAAAREAPGRLMKMASYLATYGHFRPALRYARRARYLIEHEQVSGRALAQAPALSDINNFIQTVEKDLEEK